MTHHAFHELLNVENLQELMERFYRATGIPVGIIDVEGNIHVATGWQDICTNFHRAHPETLARCRQSDAYIRDNLHVGGYIEYKCRNGLWDLAVPLVIADKHLATLFLGQFFYEDEVPDHEFFSKQAREFGFDEDRYMAALNSVPVFTREKVISIMDYYTFFVRFLIETGLNNLKRIETENALRNSQEQMRMFFHASPDNIMVTSLSNDEIFEVNGKFTRTLGYARDELAGKTSRALKLWARKEEQETFSTLMAGVGHCEYFEAGFNTKEGMCIPMLISSQRIDIEGEALIISICRDITERKRFESALKESEARYRAIVEEFDGIIYICSKDFRIEFMNERLILRTGRDATGEYCYKALHGLDELCPWCVNEKVFQGEKVRWEVQSPKDGRWYYVVNTPIHHQDGSISKQACIIDITDRKLAEEEKILLELRIRETQKLESLGVLAGGIAHDFNNILTAIIGNASLARMQQEPTAPVYSYLEKIETSSQRAADLCNQMLAYSGKGQFNVMRFDLTAIVEETTHLLQLSISKKVVLKFDLARNLPVILADATQIRQIIMNLVINASEAIGEKSGMILIATGVMYADHDYLKEEYLSSNLVEGNYVYLEISDNGCGMDKETSARIFDPFYTTKFTGRGLGLAAVLGIVRGHKGALKLYSELGCGTTFKLLLPCTVGPAEEYGTGLVPPSSLQGSGTILVVDDEETVRTVIADMLESFGFQVEMARDGLEALAMFSNIGERIRLVLIDLTMPNLDGLETFCELRRMKSDIKVIIMSGFTECDMMDRFPGKEIIGFIQKPFSAEKLLEKLQNFCQAVPAE
jgi:two-component system cell cycle sensor histidine kinase/response regulator CckA